MDNETRKILTQAFPFSSHKWRVLNTSKKGDKATWYVYVDARDVAQRLDETGLDWSDEYEVVAMTDKLCVVQCKLTIGNSTRTDVGSDSKSSIDNEGNFIKGAYSDALKRAAVKFGVGRYLYGMTSIYLPIDEFKRFTPESETRIKAHLSKELKAFGASGNVEDLRNDDAAETETEQPVQPPTKSNGHKPKPVEDAPKNDGVAAWADNPDMVLIEDGYKFSNPAEAMGWGEAMKVFKDYRHCENAYNEVKREHSPKTATEMWALWINEVARRVMERDAEPVTA